MQNKKEKKNLQRIIKGAFLDNPEALLASTICSKCGNIKVLEGRCIVCSVRRRERMEFAQAKRDLGIQPLEIDEVREEYLKIFRNCPKQKRLHLQRLALTVALKELRNCYMERSTRVYSLPVYNQDRLNRILAGIDAILYGFANRTLNFQNQNKSLDFLITGNLGTTWHQ
jgi:hypothetical protein